MRKNISRWVGAVFCALLFLQGCGLIVPLNIKKYSDTDLFKIGNWDVKYVDLIIETGKELGYRVSSNNKDTGELVLIKETSTFGYFITGKMNSTVFSFIPDNSSQSIHIKAFGSGNFSSGEREIVLDKLRIFENKLQEKITLYKSNKSK